MMVLASPEAVKKLPGTVANVEIAAFNPSIDARGCAPRATRHGRKLQRPSRSGGRRWALEG
jgi:hypothetical protein